jgi:hypothetical protein
MQIEVHGRMPPLEGTLGHWAITQPATAATCGGNHPMYGANLRQRCTHCRTIGQIKDNRCHSLAMALLQRRQASDITVDCANRRTLCNQAVYAGSADTAGGTGDDDMSLIESLHGCSFVLIQQTRGIAARHPGQDWV